MKAWKRFGDDRRTRIGRREIVERTFRESGGGSIDFALYLERHTVCTLVVTASNLVILTRQFRPGPEMYLDELPGGAIEDDELPEEAAQRETLEEVGYTGELISLGQSFSCAYSTRTRYHFLMRNATQVGDPCGDADEREQGTLVVLKDRKAFTQQVASGLLTDGETALRAMRQLGW